MKRIGRFSALLCLLASFSLSSCNDQDDLDFSLYYDAVGKGIDVYAWKDEGDYYSGILPGTNRVKQASEIVYLQENYPCPLNKMRQIIATYSDEAIDSAFISIVDNPCTTIGPISCIANEEELDEYVYVCGVLGLNVPEVCNVSS